MSGWCNTCAHYKTLYYLQNTGVNVDNYLIEKNSDDARSDEDIMKAVRGGSTKYSLACTKYRTLFTQLKDNCSGYSDKYS